MKRRKVNHGLQEVVTILHDGNRQVTQGAYDDFLTARDAECGELRAGRGFPLVEIDGRPVWASYIRYL